MPSTMEARGQKCLWLIGTQVARNAVTGFGFNGHFGEFGKMPPMARNRLSVIEKAYITGAGNRLAPGGRA
jgi:hypothetical protein